MIALVLDHPGSKAFGNQVDALAMAIVSPKTDFRIARYATAQARHAEASLPIFVHIFGEGRNFGIDIDDSFCTRCAEGLSPPARFDDHDLLGDMHLWCCQSRAVVFAHGVNQVINKTLDLGGGDLIWRKGLGHLTQNGMPHAGDFENHTDFLT
jgi:hypothetical protein